MSEERSQGELPLSSQNMPVYSRLSKLWIQKLLQGARLSGDMLGLLEVDLGMKGEHAMPAMSVERTENGVGLSFAAFKS